MAWQLDRLLYLGLAVVLARGEAFAQSSSGAQAAAASKPARAASVPATVPAGTPPAATPAAAARPSPDDASTSGGKSVEDLAKASQNPVADMISVPFQNNFNFNQGSPGGTQYILNVQPVVPFSLNENWNLVTRTIIPTITTPLPFGERVTGIGDLNPTFFLSPVKPTDGLIWGAGPVFVLPTATNELTGQGKWSVGPSFVAVKIAGPWVIGALINNVWSVAGNSARESVNQMTLQPFLNYNFSGGWYLTSSPIVTADWKQSGDERWVVPVGGGFGRVFKLGDQAINASLAGYYNVIRPDNSADWQLRFQVQLLFPK
jgi:hypothetical protein